MVDIQTIEIENYRFLAITYRLPKLEMSLIYCTKGILISNYWNLEELEKDHDAIILLSNAKSIEKLLEDEIINCSQNALAEGIYIGMRGKEALLKLVANEKTNQEKETS